MSNENNIRDIINELETIEAKYDRMNSLKSRIDQLPNECEAERNAVIEQIYERLKNFKKNEDKDFAASKPRISQACSIIPPQPPKRPETKNPVQDIILSALNGFLAVVFLAIWVVLVIINPDNTMLGYIMLSIILMLVFIVAWFVWGARKLTSFSDWQKEQKKYEQELAQWENSFNTYATESEDSRFIGEFKLYDQCFTGLVAVCDAKYQEQIDIYMAEADAIENKYVDMHNETRKELLSVIEELEKVTLIHSDLFHNAWRISSILKNGRADSLKEAINLALTEERMDIEEATRREEARKQEEILERQARDNRLHNEAMQRAAEEEARAARAHNKAMEQAARDQARAAEAQAREAAKQTQFAQQQARDAQKAASARCARCANYSKCSFQARQNAVNCSGYRPR